MEIAFHLTSIEDSRRIKSGTAGRIYWGHEFCENLIPAEEETKRVIDICRHGRLGFTFLTPFVTERGFKILKRMFVFLRREAPACEVVLNDWGVLNLLHREFKGSFILAVGRLLTHQLRDPDLEKIISRQPPLLARRENGKLAVIFHKLPAEAYMRGVRSSYLNAVFSQDLLAAFGIERVELNNLIQGVDLCGLKLKKSLYTPFVQVSTGRFCPMLSEFQKLQRIGACRKECLKSYDVLRGACGSRPLFKKGNTLFYENPVRQKDKLLREVDRLVVQSELPFKHL